MIKNKTKLSAVLLIGSLLFITINCLAQEDIIIKQDSVELEKRLKELSNNYCEFGNIISTTCGNIVDNEYGYYVCPNCGKKTRRNGRSINELIAVENIVKKIKDAGYDVILEQKEYCKYCSHRMFIKDASLVFKIRFSSNSDYHVARLNNLIDYFSLIDFLSNKKIRAKGDNIYEVIEVINKMTGLGSEIIISNPKPKK